MIIQLKFSLTPSALLFTHLVSSKLLRVIAEIALSDVPVSIGNELNRIIQNIPKVRDFVPMTERPP